MEFPQRPLTWVYLGDSITQGVKHTYLEKTWFELAQERLKFQLFRNTDVHVNAGVSGWSTAMVLERFDWLAGRFQPEVLSIALGTNDAYTEPAHHAEPAETAERLSELVRLGREAGAREVLLHTPVLIARSAYETRPNFDAYAPAIREVAARTGATLVDHDRRWRACWGAEEPLAWMDDPIHPNARGHREMADVFLDALDAGPFDDLSV